MKNLQKIFEDGDFQVFFKKSAKLSGNRFSLAPLRMAGLEICATNEETFDYAMRQIRVNQFWTRTFHVFLTGGDLGKSGIIKMPLKKETSFQPCSDGKYAATAWSVLRADATSKLLEMTPTGNIDAQQQIQAHIKYGLKAELRSLFFSSVEFETFGGEKVKIFSPPPTYFNEILIKRGWEFHLPKNRIPKKIPTKEKKTREVSYDDVYSSLRYFTCIFFNQMSRVYWTKCPPINRE